MALRLGVLAGMLACNPLASLPLPASASASAASFLTGLAASALVFGLFTSWIAWVGGACALVGLIEVALDAKAITLGAHVLSAIALALLGPGAYSMDALPSGRRIARINE